MMSDFRGGGGSKITPKNRTLEGKNQTLDNQKNRTSFVDVPEHLGKIICFYFNASHNVLCLKQSDVRILEEFELHL